MKKLYPLLFIFLLPFFLQAQQDDLTIDGTVTVQSDGLLYVQGNVNIKSGGVLDIQSSGSNRGKVHVNIDPIVADGDTGRWTCNGTTTGTGEVKFLANANPAEGDVNYLVKGSNVSFPHLILDFGKPVGTVFTNTMTFNDSVTVTQSLTLSKGRIITASGKHVYISNSAPDAIQGNFGTNWSRYIQGTLRRAVAVGATNYYLFPIGVAPSASPVKKGYNPVSIDLRTGHGQIPSNVTTLEAKFVETPAGASGNINGELGNISINTIAPEGSCYFTSSYQVLEFFHMVKEYGYWDIKPNDGGDTTGWYYDFYCFPDKAYLFNKNPGLTHLKVFKANKSFNPGPGKDWGQFLNTSGNFCNGVNVVSNDFYWYEGPGEPLEQTDSIAAWSLTSFSRFGLGGGAGAGLPIELLYLQAYPVDNEFIMVDWATATEINNRGFEIMRSSDGVDFEKIGWRDGAPGGNSSVNRYYLLEDRDVEPNVLYYYYLRQIDYDGTLDSTYVVSAMIVSSSVFTIGEFVPNPTADASRITVISDEEKKLNVTVYNTLGQVIMGSDRTVVAGVNTIDFDFDLLADGTYFAIFMVDNEVHNRKLVLNK